MKGTPRAGGDLDGAFSLPVFSRERFYQLCSLLSSLAIDCFSFCVSLHRSFPLTFYCRPSFSLSSFRRYVRFCRLKLEFPSCEVAVGACSALSQHANAEGADVRLFVFMELFREARRFVFFCACACLDGSSRTPSAALIRSTFAIFFPVEESASSPTSTCQTRACPYLRSLS